MSKTQHSCELCGKILSSYHNLQRHKVNIHKFPRPEIITFNKAKEIRENQEEMLENIQLSADILKEELVDCNDRIDDLEQQITKIRLEHAQDIKNIKKYVEDLLVEYFKQ